jgi:hypothetical protein
VPPLKVFSDVANVSARVAPGTNLCDYLPDNIQFKKAEVVVPFRYEHGKPLIKPEQLPHLSTMMRRLHSWYLETCKDGIDGMAMGIKSEHDFIGVDTIPVEFEEIWQLYNKDALDKTLMNCYCL